MSILLSSGFKYRKKALVYYPNEGFWGSSADMIKIIIGLSTRKGSILAQIPEIIHVNNSAPDTVEHYTLLAYLSQLNKNHSERSF